MDKDAEKRYRELPGEEKVKSAEAAAAEPWSPGTEIRKLVREKLGMDNENMSKGIELKLGPSKKDKPTDLNPVLKKKGGIVRGHGCESKGKTKGKFV
jgi:hypothetical protein